MRGWEGGRVGRMKRKEGERKKGKDGGMDGRREGEGREQGWDG